MLLSQSDVASHAELIYDYIAFKLHRETKYYTGKRHANIRKIPK